MKKSSESGQESYKTKRMSTGESNVHSLHKMIMNHVPYNYISDWVTCNREKLFFIPRVTHLVTKLQHMLVEQRWVM